MSAYGASDVLFCVLGLIFVWLAVQRKDFHPPIQYLNVSCPATGANQVIMYFAPSDHPHQTVLYKLSAEDKCFRRYPQTLLEGQRPDGSFGPTQCQTALAVESLALREQICALEVQLTAAENGHLQQLRKDLRTAHQMLASIREAQRIEDERIRLARFGY